MKQHMAIVQKFCPTVPDLWFEHITFRAITTEPLQQHGKKFDSTSNTEWTPLRDWINRNWLCKVLCSSG